MTDRCGGYWSLMIQRDRAARILAELLEANPNGSGRAEIIQAADALADAQERQTNHLLTCPICGEWREEMREQAERPPIEAWTWEGSEE